jgi:hypothetical protein
MTSTATPAHQCLWFMAVIIVMQTRFTKGLFGPSETNPGQESACQGPDHHACQRVRLRSALFLSIGEACCFCRAPTVTKARVQGRRIRERRYDIGRSQGILHDGVFIQVVNLATRLGRVRVNAQTTPILEVFGTLTWLLRNGVEYKI